MSNPRRNPSRDALGSMRAMPASARAALHRGWVDAQNSPSRWPRAYEAMPEPDQMLYEFGRLAALNVIKAGLPVPIWRGTLDDAGGFHEAHARAAELIGSPWPRREAARDA
jgi:hypothetical protein